jgi:hypothetical protein
MNLKSSFVEQGEIYQTTPVALSSSDNIILSQPSKAPAYLCHLIRIHTQQTWNSATTSLHCKR